MAITTPAAPRLTADEVLNGSHDRYTILNEVGHGGMGRVYRARAGAGQIVAVKLLSTDRFVIGADERARFIRESEIARPFDHPCLVKSLDVFEHKGELVSVMEFVAGPTLHERLVMDGRPSAEIGFQWMLQAAHGLACLHDLRIVHRDVTAKNIILRENGVAAVCDFGVARRLTDPTLTGEHAPMGSLIYMSRQQRENPHDATFQDDVFSLGQVFFYIAAGINPHNAGALANHRHEYPVDVHALIERMRHADRPGRPLDGARVFLALDGFQRRALLGLAASIQNITMLWGIGPTIFVGEGRSPTVSSSTIHVLNPLDEEFVVDSIQLEYVENGQVIHSCTVTTRHRCQPCAPRRESGVPLPELSFSDQIANRLRAARYESTELKLRGIAFCKWAGGEFPLVLDLKCRAEVNRGGATQTPVRVEFNAPPKAARLRAEPAPRKRKLRAEPAPRKRRLHAEPAPRKGKRSPR